MKIHLYFHLSDLIKKERERKRKEKEIIKCGINEGISGG